MLSYVAVMCQVKHLSIAYHVCRYTDHKVKGVQTCYFLDSVPTTGMLMKEAN